MSSTRRRLATKAAVLTLTLAVSATTVGADLAGATDDGTTAAEAAESLEQAAPSVLESAAEVSTTASGPTAMAATVAGTEVVVPNDPAEGITMDTSRGPASTIDLPAATRADDAQPVAPGVVAYDNNNGSATVPVVTEQGSLAVHTTITGPEAPTRYAYPITVPGGGRVELTADGGAQVLDPAGALISTVAPPWAKDANDAAIPTRFEVEGNTLFQVVEHADAGVSYPVVADPRFWSVFGNYLGCILGIGVPFGAAIVIVSYPPSWAALSRLSVGVGNGRGINGMTVYARWVRDRCQRFLRS